MSSSLRNQVEALKVSVQEEPTTPETLLSRGKLLWEWANSFSLTGIALPVECLNLVGRVGLEPTTTGL